MTARGREEVIAAGGIIIRTVMETLGVPSLLVSDLGLREGVVIDLGMGEEKTGTFYISGLSNPTWSSTEPSVQSFFFILSSVG